MHFCSQEGYLGEVKLKYKQHIMIYLETIIAGMTVEWAMGRTSEWKVDVLKNRNLSRLL